MEERERERDKRLYFTTRDIIVRVFRVRVRIRVPKLMIIVSINSIIIIN
jgi:hypothetical protein